MSKQRIEVDAIDGYRVQDIEALVKYPTLMLRIQRGLL